MSSLLGILALIMCFLTLALSAATPHFCTKGFTKRPKDKHISFTQDQDGNMIPKVTEVMSSKKELITALANATKNAKKLKKDIEKKHLRSPKLIEECKTKSSLKGVPQINSHKPIVKGKKHLRSPKLKKENKKKFSLLRVPQNMSHEAIVKEKKHLRSPKLKKENKKKSSLKGVPQINSHKPIVKDWVEGLSDDFRRLATMHEFLNTAVLDAENYADKYEPKLRSLNISLLKCLCFVEKLSNLHTLNLTYDITSVVVPRMYKNWTQQSHRDMRNCLIVRDTLGIVKDMQKWYK